jgi:type IV pilus assembly protein PilN
MIRINLLATERRGAKAAAPKFEAAQKMVVVGSLILVVTVALLGWRYWTLSQQAAQTARDIDTARREETRLQEILKQVQEFENRRKLLQARVGLIDELRKGQTAPVVMIDQVSRALPDMTWLTSMNQSGYTLTMQGRCLNLTSLSDFIGNLEASRYFARPVEIIETSVEGGDGKGKPDLIAFTIRGAFQMAGIESAPATPATRAGGKGAAAKGGRRG